MSELQQTFSRTQQILSAFGQGSDSMQIIYQPSAISPYDRVQTLRFYGFITSLRMRVDINSMVEADIPNLDADTSRTERLTALRDMEWKSPRKQISFFIKTSRLGWQPVFDVSLLNRLPYYQVNLLPYLTDNVSFDTSNDFLLGAQIVDVGYGKLSGTDRVLIFGSVREEITTLPTDSKEISFAQPYQWTVGSASQVILPANPNRQQVTLVNRSLTQEIFINYGSMAELNKGITLMRGGGSYEINFSNIYRGAISAISASNAALTGIEAV
ncbi:hypothetical protein H6F44_11835 [Pseudanabaena sp. FACHB-1277]|uniref:Uncharacterized protein n=1 Tax=Pseudanabaena cinerea FACHB-1277 TaxID=2949581 RepID=A0A926UVN7_9CYAN|nr:hypothetical protein [Pseudanabaena cinerea]MBD2150805.1 hypothetical protein [Pseudanabaena cinerea FACHB-1277]